jgi:hypothetical protein
MLNQLYELLQVNWDVKHAEEGSNTSLLNFRKAHGCHILGSSSQELTS